MITMTIAEFHAALKAQGVSREDVAFTCPMCGKIQSMQDFVAAGRTLEQAEQQIGFSCIGRWTDGAPAFSAEAVPERGCDWTLGGLFQVHKFEVIDEKGKKHPRFEIATPAEAQKHANERMRRATDGKRDQ